MDKDVLAPFLDEHGRLAQYPAKRSKQIAALKYVAAKLERERDYSEPEINEAIGQWHTFGDYCLLRRDMCDLGLLARDRDGTSYRAGQTTEE